MSTAPALSGKRALVTGASGSIGHAIAARLAREGAQLLLHANSRGDAVQALAEAIRAEGGHAEPVVFDLRDDEAVQQATAAMLAGGPVQIVVNNAGIHDDAPMAGMNDAQWHRVIDVSLHGFFHVTRPLLLPMSRQRWGRIVSVSSVAAVLGNRGQVNYAAAKAALHGATKSLAREMASRGISANVVAPGLVEGTMLGDQFDAAQVKALVPAGRAGTPAEVAAVVAFLCSDAAGYVNGQVIGVNGGMG